uniref:Uncharacterized protein n=1 Tax=Salix viminalis TaxID=40686 RepID=A0A6N2KLS8_SALVM
MLSYYLRASACGCVSRCLSRQLRIRNVGLPDDETHPRQNRDESLAYLHDEMFSLKLCQETRKTGDSHFTCISADTKLNLKSSNIL